jgi:hypothetical protein
LLTKEFGKDLSSWVGRVIGIIPQGLAPSDEAPTIRRNDGFTHPLEAL